MGSPMEPYFKLCIINRMVGKKCSVKTAKPLGFMLLNILGGDLKITDVKILYVLLCLWGHGNNL